MKNIEELKAASTALAQKEEKGGILTKHMKLVFDYGTRNYQR